MKTIGLIGGASGQALTEELQKKGYSVAIVAGKKDEPGMEIAEYVLATDLSNKEEIFCFFQSHNVEHVLIGTGHILAFQTAEYLEQKGMKLSCNIKASFIAKDKAKFKEKLNSWKILTPKSVVVDKADSESISKVAEKVGFPCVIKSCIDKLYPQKVLDKAELKTALEEVLALDHRALCEEFIDGVDTTIAVVSDGSKIEACVVNYYSKAMEVKLKGFGAFEQRKLSENGENALKRCVEQVTKLAEFRGLPRFDTMVAEEDKVYILECNSVGVTGVNKRHQAYAEKFLLADGINYAELLVKTSLNYWKLL